MNLDNIAIRAAATTPATDHRRRRANDHK